MALRLDLQALLADTDIDAVYIALPNAYSPSPPFTRTHTHKHVPEREPFLSVLATGSPLLGLLLSHRAAPGRIWPRLIGQHGRARGTCVPSDTAKRGSVDTTRG